MPLNRIRTGYGRFNANMNQMGLSPSASCECGATDQTAQHIAASVRCTVVKETWWCWTLQLATGCTTCNVTSKNNPSIKRKKKKLPATRRSGFISTWREQQPWRQAGKWVVKPPIEIGICPARPFAIFVC